jgi:hypothetical protein
MHRSDSKTIGRVDFTHCGMSMTASFYEINACAGYMSNCAVAHR